MNTKFLVLTLALTGCGSAVDTSTGSWESVATTEVFSSDESASTANSITSETGSTTAVIVETDTSDVVQNDSSDVGTVPSVTTTEGVPSDIEGTSDVAPPVPSTEVVDTTAAIDTSSVVDTSETTADTTSDLAPTTDTTTSEDANTTAEVVTEEGITAEVVTEEEASTDDADPTSTNVPSSSAAETSSETPDTTEPVVVLLCTPGASCDSDNNPCTNDVCSADGMTCEHPNKADGTSCGNSSGSTCDNPDSCLSGVCEANHKPAGTSCDTDQNVCTANECNGTGVCQVKAAPSNTVCAAATCNEGVTLEAAICGGSTTCPAAREVTECFGSCNAQGTGCELPGIEEVHTSLNPIEQLTGNSTHLYFMEAGAVRRMSKTSHVVETLTYTKDANTGALMLFPSNDVLLTVEAALDWSSYTLYCSDLDEQFPKVMAGSLSGSTLRVVMDGAKAYVSIAAIGQYNAFSSLYKVHCDAGIRTELVYTTDAHTVIVGNPVVTPNNIYIAVMDWLQNDGHSHTYGQRLKMLSKSNIANQSTAEDMGYVKTSQPTQNIEVAYAGGKIWFRNPNHVFSVPVDVTLDNSLLAEELPNTAALGYPSNVWSSNYVYGGDFRRTSLATGVTENWNQFSGVQYGFHLDGNTAYFLTDCWESGPECNDAIYSMPVE